MIIPFGLVLLPFRVVRVLAQLPLKEREIHHLNRGWRRSLSRACCQMRRSRHNRTSFLLVLIALLEDCLMRRLPLTPLRLIKEDQAFRLSRQTILLQRQRQVEPWCLSRMSC